TLRGRHEGMAFIDMGDHFLALSEAPAGGRDIYGYFGRVADNQAATRRALKTRHVNLVPGSLLGFYDPWDNLVQVVKYSESQFTEAPHILRGMGLKKLKNKRSALKELRANRMNPKASQRGTVTTPG
ncbi:MAG: VOC family protein, partial [bacterium]|nr:VOC family protein [bacterium]